MESQNEFLKRPWMELDESREEGILNRPPQEFHMELPGNPRRNTWGRFVERSRKEFLWNLRRIFLEGYHQQIINDYSLLLELQKY